LSEAIFTSCAGKAENDACAALPPIPSNVRTRIWLGDDQIGSWP
jgi:hypothetical protein